MAKSRSVARPRIANSPPSLRSDTGMPSWSLERERGAVLARASGSFKFRGALGGLGAAGPGMRLGQVIRDLTVVRGVRQF
jgi:hypothetical protein